MRVKLLICTAGLAHGLLTGCTSTRYTGDSPYGKWLSADESVREVIKDGPFTMLAIEYRTGGSFLTSTRLDYYRILYRDRILVKKVERAGHWAGATVPVFFAEIYGRNGYELHIVHEQAGKPVVEHITAGDDRWRAEEGYSYGYPLSKDVRYFPPSLGTRGNGFLLTAFPASSKLLPPVAHSGGQAPDINDLVAIAPDGKSVAYVDDYAPPGIIMVSDDNGVMHDPIPIPVPDMPAQEAGVTSVDRGMRWFAGAFAWKRNDAGQ